MLSFLPVVSPSQIQIPTGENVVNLDLSTQLKRVVPQMIIKIKCDNNRQLSVSYIDSHLKKVTSIKCTQNFTTVFFFLKNFK